MTIAVSILQRLKDRNWKRLFFICGSIVAGIIVVGFLVTLFYALQVPDPSIFLVRRINESTKIYDRTGEKVLYDVHGEEKRTVVSWDEMSDDIKHATLAAEDAGFYQHSGVDVRGIIRALLHDILNRDAREGGSTITQQLVKNALLTNEKKLSRKIKEAILAIQIERAFSKDQILWLYLNQIPYGSNSYGVEAASRTYFGKAAKNLTLAEAATLAAVANAPTYYSPYGSHQAQLADRTKYVLKRMQELGFVTQEAYDQAREQVPPAFVPPQDTFPAPHFVIMVREYLISKYGEDLVQNGGLKVITTLDYDKQTIAEETVSKYAAINEKKYKASNAALVSMDPRTGQILAMVGSKNYFDTEHHGNFNVALSEVRQPGSSFKPFAYATAFGKGYSPSTVLFDLPIEFNPSCNPLGTQKVGTGDCYHPRNYSGTFTGPVTMREALARSLNVPAVETLYLAGIQDTLETARSMGVHPHAPNDFFGLSFVLGGAGVSLSDMVAGYTVFANDGIREPSTFILKIVSSDGAVLEEYKPQEERVLSSQVARMISDVLSDNEARSAVFGYNSSLVLPGRPVAAKTGTTQNNRDGWVLGYTPSLVTGIWTGNNDDTPMTAAGAGLSAAGPMWNEYMSRVLKGTPVEFFPKPDPIVSDKPMLNGDYRDYSGQIHSILYYVDINDPLGDIPSNPAKDPQYQNWEFAVQKWILETGQFIPSPTSSDSASPWVTAPPNIPF